MKASDLLRRKKHEKGRWNLVCSILLIIFAVYFSTFPFRIMNRDKDPMGAAIADYHRHGVAGRLRVFSPDFDEDEIPVDTLFRTFYEMPAIEQQALRLATGRILDVGAGAGCHTMALQEMGRDVTAIDISPLSVAVMRESGIRSAYEQDFWTVADPYDTLLMLMNGIGIVGTLAALPRFFRHIDAILAPGGQVLLDSSDIRYVFEDEDGVLDLPVTDAEGAAPHYYGELLYQMQYKRIKGASFPWLYIDFATLSGIAEAHGFRAELIAEGDHYDYLARLTRSVRSC